MPPLPPPQPRTRWSAPLPDPAAPSVLDRIERQSAAGGSVLLVIAVLAFLLLLALAAQAGASRGAAAESCAQVGDSQQYTECVELGR